MQATSRRSRDAGSAKRICCRKPAVLGDHPEQLSSSAACNQRTTSKKFLQQLSKVITEFGSKKPLRSDPDPPASIVRETAQTSRCKPTVIYDVLVEVNATAYASEGPEALREHSDAPSISLLRSYQGLKQ